MVKVTRSYEFPNAKIERLSDGRFVMFYKWCSCVSIERSRAFVAEALRLLRTYRRMVASRAVSDIGGTSC